MLFCFTYECVGFSFQPITRKKKKHQQQTKKKKKTKQKKKQKKTTNKTKTKSIQKTLQLINNVMDIVYQNNMSNQR
jgi:hypothetical protein